MRQMKGVIIDIDDAFIFKKLQWSLSLTLSLSLIKLLPVFSNELPILNLVIAKTIHQMIVYHAHRLHKCIANCRPYELKLSPD